MKSLNTYTGFRFLAIFLSLGSVFGIVIDRVTGRSLGNFEFFKQGLTPDGIHYSLRTLRFLNFSDFEALNQIKHQYLSTGITVSNYFLNPDPWERALVDPRILYSLLSTPFVALFGLNGMFAVPILSFLILTLMPMYYRLDSISREGQLLPFFLTVVLVGSLYVKFNVLANTTDGLSTLLIVVITIILYRHMSFRKVQKASLIISVLTLFACTTRQNEIFLIGILFAVLIPIAGGETFKEKLRLIAPSVTIMFFWLWYSFYKFGNYKVITASNGKALNDGNLMVQIRDLLFSLPKTSIVEVIQLWLRDPGMFLLILIAFLIVITNRNMNYIKLCFGWTLISGMILTTINAGLGSGFRYALPAIFLGSIVIMEFVAKKQNDG
jgi:hypothetical protein